MKKLVILFAVAVFAAAMTTQAATLEWGVTSTLLDNGGAHDDGGIYGPHYATAGVNLYLVYNGIGGSFNPANWFYDTVSSSLSYSVGLAPGKIIASYTTTSGDYDLGYFNQSITDLGLTSLGETSATWEAMNNRSFTIVAISDADGNFASGATWNYYTANASGFSGGTGVNGTGSVDGYSLNVSGAGAMNVIPEPATIGLMAIGASLAWLLRMKQRLIS